MFGAAKLNINHGNGSDYTSQQGCDSWRETEGPRRHPTTLVIVPVVGGLGADVSWLFLVTDLSTAQKICFIP